MSLYLGTTPIADSGNSRANTDLSNLTSQGKSYASGLGMPSSRYIDLTLGANGASYTAPANGWVSAFTQSSTMCNLHCRFINATDFQMGGSSDRYATIPVAKGAVFNFYYNGTVIYLRFIYAEGENV